MTRSINCSRHHYWLLAALFVFGYCKLDGVYAGTGDEVAYVSKSPDYVVSGTLLSALQSHATEIVLTTDYRATEKEFGAYVGEPLAINRNITIMGLPGQNPLLDLSSRFGFMELCSTCILHIVNMSITTDAQKGSDSMTSAFKGEPGSRVIQENSYSIRVACQRSQDTLLLVRDTARSKAFPALKGPQQQLVSVVPGPIRYKGQKYTDVLLVHDLALDVPLTFAAGNIPVGGYALQRLNSSRLCQRYISPECVQSKSPWQCEDEEAQRLAEQQDGAGKPAAAATNSASDDEQTWCQDSGCFGKIAAIAVAALVAGALLIVLAIWLRNRRQHSKLQQPPKKSCSTSPRSSLDLEASSGCKDAGKDAGALDKSVRAKVVKGVIPSGAEGSRKALPINPEVKGDQHRCSPDAHLDQLQRATLPMAMQQPAAVVSSADWEVSFCRTAPGLQFGSNNDKILFGELLGAGSFARVYRGKWACIDVAVKVMQHSQVDSALIRNEVELMMSLNHPNIVRAFHCVTQRRRTDGCSGGYCTGGKDTAVATDATVLQVAVPGTAGVTALCDVNLKPARPSAPRATGARRSSSFGSERAPVAHNGLLPRKAVSLSTAASFTAGAGPSTVSRLARMHSDGSEHLSGSRSYAGFARGPQSASFECSRSTPGVLPGHGGVASSREMRAAAWGRSDSMGQRRKSAPAGIAAGGAVIQSSGSFLIPVTPDIAATVAAAAAQHLSSGSILQGPDQHQNTVQMARTSSGVESLCGGESAAVQSFNIIYKSGIGSNTQGPSAVEQMRSVLQQANRSAGPLGEGIESQYLPSASSPGHSMVQGASGRRLSDGAAAANSSSNHPAAAVACGSTGSRAWCVIQDAPQGNNLQRLDAPQHQQQHQQGGSCSEDQPPTIVPGAAIAGNVSAETWLVLELCDKGTLSSISQQWKPQQEGELQMLQRLLLLQDAARGLALLHGRNIVHGDLNSQNVLVSSSSTALYGLVGKVSDFGLSRVIKQQATHRTTRTMGTLSHMPPELLRFGRMSNSVDIYSFGIMMWEVFASEGPAFKDLHLGQFFDHVVLQDARPEIPADMPDDYELLMKRCWAKEPADRPSIEQVVDCLGLMIEDRQLVLMEQQRLQQQALQLQQRQGSGSVHTSSLNAGSRSHSGHW